MAGAGPPTPLVVLLRCGGVLLFELNEPTFLRQSEGVPALLPSPRLTLQYSQMRDEVFKSNLVCAFIVLIFITTIQSLLPSTR